MKWRNKALSAVLSMAMIAGLICPTGSVMAEDGAAEAVSVKLGDVLQVSVNNGEKNLMSLYKNGMYEGKVSLSEGDNSYQIYVNGEEIKEGTIQAEKAEDTWIRYQAEKERVVTLYDGTGDFKYPATWVGNFSNIKKEDDSLYLAFNDWAPSDHYADLDYIGGGCFEKKFTYDAMDSEKSMSYKIAFGGDWTHGAVPGSDKALTFPEESTEITLWANSLSEETFDSITDGDVTVKLSDGDYTRPVGTMEMSISVDDESYAMVQTGKNLYMGTVSVEAGTHAWQNLIDRQQGTLNGTFEASEETAVTFLYNSEENKMLNTVTEKEAFAIAAAWPFDLEEEDDDEEEPVEISCNPGDLLQISINGGEKLLMSPYSGGMYEGKVSFRAGWNKYQIYLNGEPVRKGKINVESDEETWVRYYSFQDVVLTRHDGSDGFKFPAAWAGNFSNMKKGDGTQYLSLSNWAPGDSKGNLDYIGGGCFRKTFTFDAMESEQSMEYKIAFGGDWTHGAVPGSNKALTFPEGSTEITLWANSITEETFDSVTDGNVTVKLAGDKEYTRPVGTMTVEVSVDDANYQMVQTGRNTYIRTVLLDAGTHTWKNLIDEQDGALNGSLETAGETAVTFIYDSENNVMYDSITNADELAWLLKWSNPADTDQYDPYDGDDLGAVYMKDSTTFKVWAPSASKVVLKRYAKGSSGEEGDQVLEEVPMEKDETDDGEWKNGVWKVTVQGDLANTYYTYLVTVDGSTKETNDVYAKAAGLNGTRGMVVDLDATNPAGWEQDQHVMVDKPTDAVVWEVHVRDFSSDSSSGMENKGKYLAFTESGTTLNGEGEYATGIDYLKELGVNYVQLLPVFDYVNDETNESNEGFDWGYSPLNYNVPEGLYATDPYDGNVRINEFKQMVQALHENGIGVVMDVVFNHVGGDAKESWLNSTVPGYYFRQDERGNFKDSGTACGNETKSEAEMFRKYMIDSVVYWASEYHIDGFRFDLMGCHDVETMNQLRAALDELPGGEKILTYGEPWAAGTTNQAEGVTMVSQATMKQMDSRIGAFNDFIRDSLKGRVFDDSSTGFVQAGNDTEQPANCPVYTNQDTMAALQGNTNPEYPDNWAAAPSQVVSYASVHDDLGLYDKLQYSVNGITEEGDEGYYLRDENLLNMNKMAAAAVLTSQGAAFFQAGEEMARSKGGVANSYNSPLYFSSGKELNQINWNRTKEFSDLVDYYKGLLELRKAYAPFRAADMQTVENMTFSDDTISNLVAYTITSPGEKWDMVAVLMNSNTTPQEVTLKAKDGAELPEKWNCVVNQSSAGTDTLECYQGNTITVPAQTVLVLTAADTADKPDDPDDPNKPGDTTDKPGDTTNKPGDTTDKPGSTTGKPGSNGQSVTGDAGKTDKAVKNSVRTGDSTAVIPMTAILLIALFAILCAVSVRRKYKK